MSRPTSLPCPRCSAPLTHGLVGAVEVDRCPSCAGVWLDRVEVEAAVQAVEGTAPAGAWRPDPGYLKCPACGTLMNRVNYERFSGILLDVCPRHGTWADAGELERVRDFVAGGGKAERAEKEAEERRLRRSLDGWGTATSARAEAHAPSSDRWELAGDVLGGLLSGLFR